MSVKVISWVFAGAVASLVALACSSSDSGSGTGQVASVSEEQYPALFAKGVCGGFYQCDCPPSAVYDFADQAECEVELEEVATRFLEDSAGSGLVYDAECAARRVNSFQGNVCVDEVWDRTHCGVCPIFHGSAPKGASCTFDECDRGLECLAGECVDPCERVAEGGVCVETVNKCQTGMFCEGGTAGDGTCVAALGEGQGCDDSAPCGEDLACHEGTCVKAALPGESCANRPCLLTQCVSGTCATTPLGLPNVCDLY